MARVVEMVDHRQTDDDDNIVDADPDPVTIRITQAQHAADEDASFAKAEAAFAAQEHQHAQRLREERRDAEADRYEHDAQARMTDAHDVMQQANREAAEANTLREQQTQRLAVVLRELPSQSLASLATAVGEVRRYVQNLTPAEKLKVGLAGHLNEHQIEELREHIVVTGFAIEQALSSGERTKANAVHVVEDLVAFVAAVMTLADHLPSLMDLIQRFGQTLSQFHLF